MQNDVQEAVQRMKEYITEHLSEPISLSMLAHAGGYSPWHANRLFKEATGLSPLQYIRTLRLSRAVVSLRGEDRRILDVALDFAFDSHEGFTRAFSQAFGSPPKAFSRSSRPLFLPDSIRESYLKLQKGDEKKMDQLNTIFVQVVDRPARKAILKRGLKADEYFAYCDEVGCDVWETLCDVKDALYEPVGMWLPENLRLPGTSEYVQGVEVPVSYNGEIPSGFEIIELPASKMMVFQGPPYDDEKFEGAIQSVWEIMKAYNPELYGFRWADADGPRIQLEPRGERGYIEARPVRSLTV